MCLYPLIIKNRKYTKNKKNEGQIPILEDPRCEYVPVGCGKCMECKKQKSREWQVRLLEHIKTKRNGKFVTLTFSNDSIHTLLEENYTSYKINPITRKREKVEEKRSITKTDKETGEIKKVYLCDLKGYERDNAIATWAVRHFLERWRKKYKKSLEHWLVTELGHNGTENIHLHGIVFTDEIENLDKIWEYGFVWKGYYKNGKLENYVNERTVSYITKYVSKTDNRHREYNSKILTSPGIGKGYIKSNRAEENRFKGETTKEVYRTSTGHEIAMPIYWRNNIYSEWQREKLWIYRLNKEERWVCGERVSVKNGQQDYENLRQHYRKVNRELGYGLRANDNRKQEEEARRELMYQTRLRKLTKRHIAV